MDFTISGTEIGAILGLSKWQTPMDIYMKKLGLVDTTVDNEMVRWGIAAEHVVARRYARETGYRLFPSVDSGWDFKHPIYHKEYPWWTGTPDRGLTIKPPEVLQYDGLLEIKIVGERMAYQWGDAPDGDVPEQYLTQVAWYMPLLGVEWADLAVQIGNRDYRVYRINRDREFEDSLRDAALEFIQSHLIPAVPPPIDGSDSSKRYLNYKYPQDSGPMLEPTDEDILQLIEDYRMVRLDLAAYEEAEREAKNRVMALIGDCAGMKGDWGKIYWKKNKDGQSLDYKAMAAAHPEIAAKFMKFKPGARVFRPYFAKED